jgi:hypothetical protein
VKLYRYGTNRDESFDAQMLEAGLAASLADHGLQEHDWNQQGMPDLQAPSDPSDCSSDLEESRWGSTHSADIMVIERVSARAVGGRQPLPTLPTLPSLLTPPSLPSLRAGARPQVPAANLATFVPPVTPAQVVPPTTPRTALVVVGVTPTTARVGTRNRTPTTIVNV